MSGRKIIDDCHICGLHTNLTFEHVPPRAAFNNRPVINTPFEKLINADNLDELSVFGGRKSQRGSGGYTLCGNCNSNTGAWYGNAFVDWAYQGLRISRYAATAPTLVFIFRIFPLRVIKQIICMFFSVNHPGFHKAHEDLVRFVLNKHMKYLDPKKRIFVYFNDSNRVRQFSITAKFNINSAEGIKLFSEVSFPPFGYLMCIDSEPPDRRIVDISYFSEYGYNEYTDVTLRLPKLPVYTPIPGDYRGRDEVIKERHNNSE